MDFKSFVDKAKDAAAAAARDVAATVNSTAPAAPPAEAATDEPSDEPAAEQALAPAAASDQALAVPAQPSKTLATLTSDKLNELTAMGTQKVQELITSFQQALPAIKSAGYELTEFEIELGVTPKLIPHFRHTARREEHVEEARAMLQQNKLGMIILNALLKAGDVHKQIKVAGFGFSHIEIELGLIPSVRLQYKNEGA